MISGPIDPSSKLLGNRVFHEIIPNEANKKDAQKPRGGFYEEKKKWGGEDPLPVEGIDKLSGELILDFFPFFPQKILFDEKKTTLPISKDPSSKKRSRTTTPLL